MRFSLNTRASTKARPAWYTMEMTETEDEDTQLVVKRESHQARYAPVYVLDIISLCHGLTIPHLLSSSRARYPILR